MTSVALHVAPNEAEIVVQIVVRIVVLGATALHAVVALAVHLAPAETMTTVTATLTAAVIAIGATVATETDLAAQRPTVTATAI